VKTRFNNQFSAIERWYGYSAGNTTEENLASSL